MDNLVLVNKQHGLDLNYKPNDLESCDQDINARFKRDKYIRREACINFLKLRKDALIKKYDIYACSGYRTAEYQQSVFDKYFKQNYEMLKQKNPNEKDEVLNAMAYDLTAARVALPGHSEHQTGLAIDIECYYNDNYDQDICNDEEVEWMADNAYKYGFILRYPKGKEGITGYNYEPWHYRYIGEEYSYDYMKSGLTYEEYYEKVLKR